MYVRLPEAKAVIVPKRLSGLLSRRPVAPEYFLTLGELSGLQVFEWIRFVSRLRLGFGAVHVGLRRSPAAIMMQLMPTLHCLWLFYVLEVGSYQTTAKFAALTCTTVILQSLKQLLDKALLLLAY